MKNKSLMIGLIVLLLAVGIIAVNANKKSNEARIAAEQAEQQAMIQKDEDAKMMEKQDEVMMDQKDDEVDGEAMMEKKDDSDGEAMMEASSSMYVDYSDEVLEKAKMAQKSGQKVVLFFHANWCPFCVAADKDFKTSVNTENFPKNVTLIKTDYDSQTELKKKYGVTTQHTFVQIDSNGDVITKWVSGESAELTKKLK